MTPALKRIGGAVVVVVVALLAVGLQARRTAGAVVSDPDRYFHLGVSRLMVEQRGFLQALPQPEEIGWLDHFPDKESLFHVLTALGWAAGGVDGVAVVPLLCFALTLALLAFSLRAKIGTAAAVVVVVAVVAAAPFLSYRLCMVRPHALAVPLFIAFALSVAARRPRLVALSACGYALAYHALYLPLGVVAALVIADAPRGVLPRRVIGAALLGLVVGSVVNPVFPGNLISAWQQMVLALGHAPIAVTALPTEMLPLTTPAFLKMTGFAVVVVVAGAALWSRAPRAPEHAELGFHTLVTAGLCSLAALQPRALEYALPMSALLAGAVMHALAPIARAKSVAVVVVVVWGSLQLVTAAPAPDRRDVIARGFAAIDAIPRGDDVKVFNVDWSDGSLLLFRRPDLHFVDLLDPSLLAFRAPELYALRQAVADDRVIDVAGVASSVFRATHLLVNEPATAHRYARESQLRRVFPGPHEPWNAAPAVFAVHRAARSAFVVDVDGAVTGADAGPPGAALSRQRWTELLDARTGDRGVFFGVAARVPRVPGLVCAALRPTSAELDRLAGATALGLGGGPWIRAWVNGAPIAELADGSETPALVRALFPLPQPLRAEDVVDVVVCSDSPGPSFGVAVSLWSVTARAASCAPAPPEAFAAVVDDEVVPCPAPCAAGACFP